MDITTEKSRLIFGVKLKHSRQEKNLTLRELARRCGLSVSYLNEIEKGKKYPKPEKISSLAQALDIPYEKLVSPELADDLAQISYFLDSPFVQEFPFDSLGFGVGDIFELITESPSKIAAFVGALIEMARMYDINVENFSFAALRSYQEINKNYFDDIENSAQIFMNEQGWDTHHPIQVALLKSVLINKYHYQIIETDFADYPDLMRQRSVWIAGERPKILINKRLLPLQKAFILGREIGYCYLELKERAQTSSWITVESFEQVLSDFKAAYFSGALLMNRDLLVADLQEFFQRTTWSDSAFLALINKYPATPEMFYYRLSELLSKFFDVKQMHFVRFTHYLTTDDFKLTKQLNMARSLVPHDLALYEHHCRRWIPITLLQTLADKQRGGGSEATIVGVQRAHFIEKNLDFFCLSAARPLALTANANSSVTLAFHLTDHFKKTVRFWDDPAIEMQRINGTCERCGLIGDQCSLRVAAPILYERQSKVQLREAALAKLIKAYNA